QPRRSGRAVCRSQYSTEEVLCRRILLWHDTRSSAEVTLRLDWRSVALVVSASQVLRLELSSGALTNAVILRSCEKRLSTSRIKRFPGHRIFRWSSNTHEGTGVQKC